MGVAVPALETVIDAVDAEITAIASIGTVFKFEHKFEDEIEHYHSIQSQTTGDLDVWYIDLESETPLEGPANGENYVVYGIRVRYVTVRVDASDWLKTGRGKIRSVADKLNKNLAVFAINGQAQLRTPETVTIRSYGKLVDGGPVYEANMIVEGELVLEVEARDFS